MVKVSLNTDTCRWKMQLELLGKDSVSRKPRRSWHISPTLYSVFPFFQGAPPEGPGRNVVDEVAMAPTVTSTVHVCVCGQGSQTW